MTSKAVGILVIAAAGLAAAAWFTVSKRAEAPAPQTQKLAPALEPKVNDVSRVEVLKAGTSTVLVRTDAGGWALESRGGYPAEFEKVKGLVVGVATAEILEPKTSKPENYERIGVQDPRTVQSPTPPEGAPEGAPPAPEAPALVTLKDKGGTTLASIIVGNRSTSGGTDAAFVRRDGEPQSYLAKGIPTVDAAPTNWMNRELMRIDGTRVQRVQITHAKPAEGAQPPADDQSSLAVAPNEQIVIERPATPPGGTPAQFTLTNMPAGRELKTAGALSPIGSALSYVDMEDVLPVAQVAQTPVLATTEYRTFDGLVVTVTVREKDGKTWATFAASAVPVTPAQPAPAEGETPPPPPEPAVDPKVAEEVKTLNDKLGPWAFAIPSWKAGYFKSTMKDLLKDPTATPPAEPGPIGPSSAPAPPG